MLPACNGAYIATSFLEGDSDEPLIVAAYEVVPETVCQYTGLTDRDGKKIWEMIFYEVMETMMTSKSCIRGI